MLTLFIYVFTYTPYARTHTCQQENESMLPTRLGNCPHDLGVTFNSFQSDPAGKSKYLEVSRSF